MSDLPARSPQPADVPQQTQGSAGGAPADAAPSAEVLKAALKAFKKRLKLTQLDDASRIGHGPMSGGHQSTILGITPPDQYPRAVWEALVKAGKLKNAGSNMYSLNQ